MPILALFPPRVVFARFASSGWSKFVVDGLCIRAIVANDEISLSVVMPGLS